ncbi:restriction endonuclease [Janthinobacterium lividum]
MIEDPYPPDWKALQAGVARLFNEIGLSARIEEKLKTPRGEVEIDVFAVDEASVDKIRYLVECKNWNSAIPQTVVHAFNTVMAETGANIGFIVSRKGLQAGAERYTDNTNIVGMTYLELQERYFPIWWERWFCRQVGDVGESLEDFVEPFNPRRDELVASLTRGESNRFNELLHHYGTFGLVMGHMNMAKYVNMAAWPAERNRMAHIPESVDQYIAEILEPHWPHLRWKATTFRDLMTEIISHLNDALETFRSVFGGDINEVYERREAPA